MEKPFYKGFKIGVLGGGQLGRMLLQKSYSYNLEMAFVDPDPKAPCREISNWFYKGDLNDFQMVYDFGKKCDVVSIEIENVNVDALTKLEKEGVKVFPQPAALKTIQDKGLQKLFYQKNNINTSEFFLIENKNEVVTREKILQAVWGYNVYPTTRTIDNFILNSNSIVLFYGK